jgi:ferritin
MLDAKIEKALNDQINAEFHSAYIYLAMAAYFEDQDLPGFAAWMNVQVKEELTHGQKIYDYVFERDGRVALTNIEAPPKEWQSPLDAFEAAYKHEQYITGRINDLVALAREIKDTATENFLQWFVAEQVEEEATAKGIVQSLKIAKDSGAALLMLDRELGTRTFVAPPAE